MDRYKKALIVVSIFCGITILAFSTVLFFYLNSFGTYSNMLENIYKKNLYELVNSVNSVEVDISKIIATTSFNTQQKLLNSIYVSCNDIEKNLSDLPVSQNKTDKVTNLYNVLSGYTYSLIRKNETLNQKSLTDLEELHSSCLVVMYDLNSYLQEVSYDYNILNDINFNKELDNKFEAGFTETNKNDNKVPSLIYDGPFSESTRNKEIKGLGKVEVTMEQALDIVKEKMRGYKYDSIKYVGDTLGKFKTYNFEVISSDITLFVQVTKMGGKIISLNANAESGKLNYSLTLSKEMAQNFALSLGYEDMYPVWSQTENNIIYVNLAPMVNGIIYYPDLVKVKVDKSRAQVIGLDATNYCYNHVKRETMLPKITKENAMKKVSSKLKIDKTNLAIIPKEFVGETFVYEFVCTWKDYEYFVYVDANTGEEVDILRVIKMNSGNLII